MTWHITFMPGAVDPDTGEPLAGLAAAYDGTYNQARSRAIARFGDVIDRQLDADAWHRYLVDHATAGQATAPVWAWRLCRSADGTHHWIIAGPAGTAGYDGRADQITVTRAGRPMRTMRDQRWAARMRRAAGRGDATVVEALSDLYLQRLAGGAR